MNVSLYSSFVTNLLTLNDSYDPSTTRYNLKIPRVFKCPRPENCPNSDSHTPIGINVLSYEKSYLNSSTGKVGAYYRICLQYPVRHVSRLNTHALLFSLIAIFLNILVAAVPVAVQYQATLSTLLILLDVGIVLAVAGEVLLVLLRFIREKIKLKTIGRRIWSWLRKARKDK
ncbi:hypothetical protein BSL78_22641 [Apostichopus japonicus]|uniref:Uncharacterized protein n=1 Tax=Stichopus japonicus TaxID=307972 RepID=A0A2G8JXN4_STIJA|nr:hypothetical protein BSL78_22641 [Apostichopus japonicus]